MNPSYSETGGPVLTLDFGKSDVIEIMKQSAIRVNMKAGSQRLLSMNPGASCWKFISESKEASRSLHASM